MKEKDEWSDTLVQAVQLNDNLIRSLVAHVESLRAEMNHRYEQESIEKKEFRSKLDEANIKIDKQRHYKKTYGTYKKKISLSKKQSTDIQTLQQPKRSPRKN